MKDVLALVLVLSTVLGAATAQAQPTQLPEPQLLRAGDRAPFTGQLMAQEDVLRFTSTIETLEARLTTEAATAVTRCDIKLELERARTAAAGEIGALHESLWRERSRELVNALTQARESAVRRWWESGALWFAIGVALTTGVTVALAIAIR